jgi:hypothetical protein
MLNVFVCKFTAFSQQRLLKAQLYNNIEKQHHLGIDFGEI